MADQTEQTESVARSGRRIVREILLTAALAGLVFFLIQTTFQNFRVEGSSMDVTLEDGQLVLVNKMVYRRFNVGGWAKYVPFLDRDRDGVVQPFHEPSHGEVVVLRFPNDPDRKFIKRIIAVPGDLLEIRQGIVYVNRVRSEEPYVERPGGFTMAATRIPEGHFWVMGDNRPGSSDSRHWGMLPRENIIGKAWVAYWPLGDWGVLRSYAS